MTLWSSEYNIDAQEILDYKDYVYSTLDSDSSYILYQNVEQTLEVLYNANIAIAIASNGSENYLRTISSMLGIDKYISVYSGLCAKKRSKPAPDIYANALSLLGVDSSMAIAVEDSIVGIKSAKATGIYTFAITNSFEAKYLKESDKIINKIDEIFNYIEFKNTKIVS